jgi:hypothetical protein
MGLVDLATPPPTPRTRSPLPTPRTTYLTNCALASPEIEAAELAVHDAAGRPGQTGGGGQGFMTDQKAKLVVEAHAMKLARTHYSRLGAVVDTASHRSWDYEVDIAGDRWHVEVKGTTGDPVEVILTPNEVAHAKAYPFVALYVVSSGESPFGARDDDVTLLISNNPYTGCELGRGPRGARGTGGRRRSRDTVCDTKRRLRVLIVVSWKIGSEAVVAGRGCGLRQATGL